ncbi:MAG: citrate synthase [Myxococcota bacterium]
MWLTSDEACARLGVKRATLYTYASRGQVRTRSDGGRTRQYHRDDLEVLAGRSAAHAGSRSRAAAALAWGEPVLTTAISAIDPDGPYYRGVPALDCVDEPLERIAERLWDIPASPWPHVEAPPCTDLLALRRHVDAMAAEDPDRAVWTGAAELERAKRIVGALRHACRLPDHPDLRAAQVLTADHELNASTFTARVVASTGADLYACVAAALAALSGPRHGAASLEVHHVLERFTSGSAAGVLEQAASTGLPGFGHPLYPHGDPRAEHLLHRTRGSRETEGLRRLVDAVAPLGLLPNLDVGLLAVCQAHGLPATAGALLFASARSVGWIAHVFEQRTRPGLLRPRADYAGWAPVPH